MQDTSSWVKILIKFILPLVKMALGPMGQVILDIIREILLWMMLGLLSVLDSMMQILKAISGMVPVTYKGKSQNIFDVFINIPAVNRTFWAIFVAAMVLGMLFSIVAVARSSLSEEGEAISQTLLTMGRTMLTFLLIPLLITVGLRGSAAISKFTMDALEVGTTGVEVSLGKSLFLTGSMGQELPLKVKVKGSNKGAYIKPKNSNYRDAWREPFYSGKLDYTNTKNVSKYFNFSVPRIIFMILIGIFAFFMLTISALLYIRRIMDILILYLFSPYFVAMIPLDQGKRFKEWRNMLIGKLASGFCLIMMLELANLYLFPFITSNVIMLEEGDSILRLLFVAGSLYGVYRSHIILVQVINPKAAESEKQVGRVIGDVFSMGARSVMGRVKAIGNKTDSKGEQQ